MMQVATLVAPLGASLTAQQTAETVSHIEGAGGHIESTKIFPGKRAAAIFFTGGQGFVATGRPFDILIQPVAHRRKKILIADMESTVIEQEMLDELAGEIGVGEKVAAITSRAMNGELDFTAALSERVALLKGQPESLLQKVALRMSFTSGARDLIAAMKRAGGQCWLVSGGFTCFIKLIAEQAGFDRFFGNRLEIENGVLTGKVLLPILGKDTKKELLERACADFDCVMAQTVAIGDGANDVPMLRACHEGGGLGVAYRAKPNVRAVIPNQINHGDLATLLFALDLF
jgi:phosphoserine phosphatase